jgi:hypothetical protein
MVTCIVTLALQPRNASGVSCSSGLPRSSLRGRPISGRPEAKPHRFTIAPQSPLCFHNLTNSFSRSPFPLITIQNAWGCHPSQVERVFISSFRQRSSSFFSSAYALFARSLALRKTSTRVFSMPSALFRKNTRGGGVLPDYPCYGTHVLAATVVWRPPPDMLTSLRPS